MIKYLSEFFSIHENTFIWLCAETREALLGLPESEKNPPDNEWTRTKKNWQTICKNRITWQQRRRHVDRLFELSIVFDQIGSSLLRRSISASHIRFVGSDSSPSRLWDSSATKKDSLSSSVKLVDASQRDGDFKSVSTLLSATSTLMTSPPSSSSEAAAAEIFSDFSSKLASLDARFDSARLSSRFVSGKIREISLPFSTGSLSSSAKFCFDSSTFGSSVSCCSCWWWCGRCWWWCCCCCCCSCCCFALVSASFGRLFFLESAAAAALLQVLMFTWKK